MRALSIRRGVFQGFGGIQTFKHIYNELFLGTMMFPFLFRVDNICHLECFPKNVLIIEGKLLGCTYINIIYMVCILDIITFSPTGALAN